MIWRIYARGVTSKVLRKVPRTSRRQQYSASTKRALVDAAAELFTAQGYAGTSLDEVVAAARVTKGALYHHFSGKAALFEAVFERIEDEASKAISRAVRDHRDPWAKADAGLREFLEVVQRQDYRRVVIQDGPAVLGYERYREQEERSTFGIVQDIVSTVLDSYDLEPSMVETFSRVFFGAMSAAGAAVSGADNPRRASAEVEAAIGFILAGLRQQAESGERLPSAEELAGGTADDDAATEPKDEQAG